MTYHEPDNPHYPGAHGDGCRCLNCTYPQQSYCENCGGPCVHEGGGWFKGHSLEDCIAWLKERHSFNEPVVFDGCRPRDERTCECRGIPNQVCDVCQGVSLPERVDVFVWAGNDLGRCDSCGVTQPLVVMTRPRNCDHNVPGVIKDQYGRTRCGRCGEVLVD